VPRLWSETIEDHRHEVREAILDATWTLVTEHGLSTVTMSRIAQETGIGRATLYKYFPDVEAILVAWHERHVIAHHARLATIRDQGGDAFERLEAVLREFATIAFRRGRHDAELVTLLHRDKHVARVRRQVRDLVRGLIAEAADAGDVRSDIAPEELAGYCIHALTAAGNLSSRAALDRLVSVTLDGLGPSS
jgi:AcrR family transcriptional regulator